MAFFPGYFGLSTFGGEDEESFYRLIRSMQGEGGYTAERETNRMREVHAHSVIAALGANAIGRAAEQSWPDRSTEMLGEWEEAFILPNNAARTQEERQARLRACRATRCIPSSIETGIVMAGASETPSDVLLSFDDLDFVRACEAYMIAEED